jgi:hypothetical protein
VDEGMSILNAGGGILFDAGISPRVTGFPEKVPPFAVHFHTY